MIIFNSNKMDSNKYTAFKNAKVFNSLDGLRFLSIMPVVWHHTPARELTNITLLKRGFLGVDLFFVISGFLIVTLLLRENEKTNYISLRKFYIRRSLRIFPLYYAVILFYAILYAVVFPGSENGRQYISEIWIYLTYTSNYFPVILSVVWSLATEEQFYLLWPTIEKFFKKYIPYILVVVLVINQLINFHVGGVLFTEITGWHIPYDLAVMQATFTPILLGVTLAHMLNNPTTFVWMQKVVGYRIMPIIFLAILLLLCEYDAGDISGLPRLSIQIIMMLLLASCVVNEKHYLTPILTNSVVMRIGAISYGIYLLHMLCIDVTIKSLHYFKVSNELIIFLFAACVSIAVAEISYRYYEVPFLRYKERFSVIRQRHA